MSTDFGQGNRSSYKTHRSGGRDDRRGGGSFSKGQRQGGGFRGKGEHREGGLPGKGDRRDPKRFGDRGGRKPYGQRAGKPFGDRQSNGRFDGPSRERQNFNRGGRPGVRRDRNAPFTPNNGDSELLKGILERIGGKSFGAYRDVEGAYAFDGYELHIDRVQRDPFAPPSKIVVRVPQDTAGFDPKLFAQPWRRTAVEDHILRAFGQAIAKNSFDFADFIKGGAFNTSRPAPEIIARSACTLDKEALTVRFEATFPARERSVAAREFETMFFDALPRIVRDSLLAVSYAEGALEAVANLADDQHALRRALAERDLVAFVADGAILPRETGISQRPMKDAKPFASPESLRIGIETPHSGTVFGMGIPAGVTLIVGGGYHGKSTLLKAIQNGVYDHIAGDGREFVVCDPTATKLRAEDGRSVRGTDISLFINNLPSGISTESFWTDNASGSTSQAASTAEALEARCKLFLIDEDTSATNFIVREPLMQAVIARDVEPITPFVERLRDLYEQTGVSTIIVAGSSGAFFGVADTIIQMENYEPKDIADIVEKACAEQGGLSVPRAAGFSRPNADRLIAPPQHPLMVKTASDARKADKERREGHARKEPERLSAKVLGGVDVRVGSVGSDLRFVEQMIDAEQAKTLSLIVKRCMEGDLVSRMSVVEIVDELWRKLENEGFEAVSDTRRLEGGMAMPRREEIFCCLNRLRPRD